MTAIDRLRDANRYPMKLANGIPITFRLPYLEELIVAGVLPLSILDEVRKRVKPREGATETEVEAIVAEAEADVAQRLAEYDADFGAKQRLVAMMVTEIDGEPVEMAPADTRELPPENFRELVGIAIRQEPPRAEGEV